MQQQENRSIAIRTVLADVAVVAGRTSAAEASRTERVRVADSALLTRLRLASDRQHPAHRGRAATAGRRRLRVQRPCRSDWRRWTSADVGGHRQRLGDRSVVDGDVLPRQWRLPLRPTLLSIKIQSYVTYFIARRLSPYIYYAETAQHF